MAVVPIGAARRDGRERRSTMGGEEGGAHARRHGAVPLGQSHPRPPARAAAEPFGAGILFVLAWLRRATEPI
jgi:hypothetical protein